MAETDTIDVKFKTQRVFHDGASMIVAKKGETRPVERRLIAGFVVEGVINAPKGWAEELAAKNEIAVADGAVQVRPAGEDAAP